MYKYAKITDSKTGLCDVGLGSNEKFYKSLGMSKMDVAQGFDGQWYLAEKLCEEDYLQKAAEYRKNVFEKEFFNTSLGWIRREVRMKDGNTRNFLSDLLLQIKAGLELGVNVNVITYKLPDFTKELSDEYIKSIQETKSATPEFIQECLMQTVTDWEG